MPTSTAGSSWTDDGHLLGLLTSDMIGAFLRRGTIASQRGGAGRSSMIDWAWIGDHLGAILSRTIQHLELAAIAVFFGFAISFGLAVLVAVRRRSTYPLISGLAGLLYTIPSLAVFAALVSVTGLTIFTAEIPLIMYTLVILVRNIVAGFDATPGDVLEAADGMGYDRRERFRRVVLPLPCP